MENNWIQFFPEHLSDMLNKTGIHMIDVQEIRLRVGKPLYMSVDGIERYVSEKRGCVDNILDAYFPKEKELEDTLRYMGEYSVYAFEEEIKQGFMTLQGGHRVGITGKPVILNGEVKTFQYITGINFRIAHEVKGAADAVIRTLLWEKGILNTLILSPPGYGKTTMLRDLVRQISNGNQDCQGVCVAVVDERSEIGGSYHGVPQTDLGMRTDILDACPKAEGMMMLIRAMNPKVVAIDELGGKEDTLALRKALRCGIKILATAHGESIEDLSENPNLRSLIQEQVFERYLILRKPENGKHDFIIYNRKLQKISGTERW